MLAEAVHHQAVIPLIREEYGHFCRTLHLHVVIRAVQSASPSRIEMPLVARSGLPADPDLVEGGGLCHGVTRCRASSVIRGFPGGSLL